MYVVLKVQTFIWPGGSVGWSAALSRRRSRVRVSSGSLLFLTANLIFFLLWDLSSAGRASALQAEGHRFEPYWSHYNLKVVSYIEYGWIPEWPKGTDCKSAA